MKLKLHWMPEAISQGVDRSVGARMVQLTSAALITHNIYCEERYTTTDGTRLALLRSPLGSPPEQLWIGDLETRQVACLSPSIQGYPTSNLYRDTLFYERSGRGSPRVLARVDLKTLEEEEVFDLSPCPSGRWNVSTISPDERYYVSNLRVQGQVWGLYRVDLLRGTWEVFHEHKDICNPHPQFEPSRGQDLLVQLNRGSLIDEEENILRLVGEEGATLYVIDRDGGNLRPLPVGKPHTPPVTGHECWVGDTGRVILTTADPLRGAIHLTAPGDEASRGLWRGLSFGHISASSEGKYFVVDDFSNGRIYVGHMENGRMLPLCDTGASCASPQYTHPHPYMTPGHRHVIFNSDRSGLGQVWAAEIPAGFLEALDGTSPPIA
jgi:hypothetical protein